MSDKSDIATQSSSRPDQITEAVMHLGYLCGMGKSESASEAFVTQLFTSSQAVLEDIYASHEEGLCLDAWRALATHLSEAIREKKRAPNRKPSARVRCKQPCRA